MVESQLDQWIAEVDVVHVRVRESFRRRDLTAYMATFAPDLTYRQADGRLSSREALARSIARQFGRLVAFDSGFERQRARVVGAELTESGTQTAWITLRVLAIFATRWKIERTGQYTWVRVGADWLLRNVTIEHERVTFAGVGLASRIGEV
jgi:hypothetical protein